MTFAIPRYPVHLIDVVAIGDGRRITIRPTLPQDIDLQRAFFRALSPEARYLRFMTRLVELPDALAESFAAIDYRSHLALLAEVFEDGRELMVGEARYVLDRADPRSCEFAVTVADGWRGAGIARALLDRIERQAAAAGILRMTADTLAANAAMIGLAARAGYAVGDHPHDTGLVRLEKALAPDGAAASPHHAARPLAA